MRAQRDVGGTRKARERVVDQRSHVVWARGDLGLEQATDALVQGRVVFEVMGARRRPGEQRADFSAAERLRIEATDHGRGCS